MSMKKLWAKLHFVTYNFFFFFENLIEVVLKIASLNTATTKIKAVNRQQK